MKRVASSLLTAVLIASSNSVVADQPSAQPIMVPAQAAQAARSANAPAKGLYVPRNQSSNHPAIPSPRDLFTGAVNDILPATTSEVRKFKQRVDEIQRAKAAPVGPAPKPVSRSVTVDLSPGAQPPTIHMAVGYGSTLTFTDATGAPWPILDFSVGNRKAYEAAASRAQHILALTAQSAYTESNLTVVLKGLPTPVTFRLVNGDKTVDYNVDATIPKVGPNGTAPASAAVIPGVHSPVLASFLDLAPPRGAQKVRVFGDDSTQAWVYLGKVFIRTPYTLTSPAWSETRVGPDGTHVYALDEQTPVVLMINDSGHVQTLKLDFDNTGANS